MNIQEVLPNYSTKGHTHNTTLEVVGTTIETTRTSSTKDNKEGNILKIDRTTKMITNKTCKEITLIINTLERDLKIYMITKMIKMIKTTTTKTLN